MVLIDWQTVPYQFISRLGADDEAYEQHARATGRTATCEAIVMGVKSGLDPQVVIDVLNAGSDATNASRNKFPRSILPRTFDFGFATGLMVKGQRTWQALTKIYRYVYL